MYNKIVSVHKLLTNFNFMANFFNKIKRNNPELEDENLITENYNNHEKIESDLTKNETAWNNNANNEGQLSVDVFQTRDSLIIKSTIAGVKPENIDISIDNDVLTIRGERQMEEKTEVTDYFYQECYWGGFSRSVVLPIEIKADEVEASIKNGFLTVILPKVKKNKSVAVKVKSE